MHRTHTWKLLDIHKSKPGNTTYAHVRTCVWMVYFRTYWIFFLKLEILLLVAFYILQFSCCVMYYVLCVMCYVRVMCLCTCGACIESYQYLLQTQLIDIYCRHS